MPIVGGQLSDFTPDEPTKLEEMDIQWRRLADMIIRKLQNKKGFYTGR